MNTRILVIEDEIENAQLINMELQAAGYDVNVAYDGVEGLSIARESEFDLILLDWMLPGTTGIEICHRLRQTGQTIPIIFLTGLKEFGDRVKGLDAGADDYITKPFNAEELLARIRSNLRRVQSGNNDVLKYSELCLNLYHRQAYRGDRSIELTTKEFNLLKYLMQHPEQVLSRKQILEQVWNWDFTDDDRIIETYIRRLRQKLELDHEKRLIKTIRGIGYTLRA